jgi:hypothetical protein
MPPETAMISRASAKGTSMRILTILTVAAGLLATPMASAATQTITRTGHIVAQIPIDDFFNYGATGIDGVSVGQAFSFSATYDDADKVNPGTVYTFLGEPVSSPNFGAVGLGNGDPVNAVSITLGSHSFQLSDQGCFQDSACIAANGMEFPTGPTLLFDGSNFLGMDSCLIEGGAGFGTGVTMCSLVLDNLAPTVQSYNTSYLGYTRTDLFLINDASGNSVFYGQFDGPGVAGLAAVPEPASWAMMIGGFGLIGAMARRRKSVPSFA